MMQPTRKPLPINPGPALLLGVLIVLLSVIGMGGWAATTKLAGAVVASGTVKVEGNRKTVQHLEGGIVEALLVREGEAVKQGDLLVRLDATVPRASLAIVRGQLDNLRAREARLMSEQLKSDAVVWPDDLLARMDDAGLVKILQIQQDHFAARRATLLGQVGLFDQQAGQSREEIRGLTAQRDAVAAQFRIIADELRGLHSLLAQGYARKPRVLEMERAAEQLKGERGRIVSDIARAGNAVVEAKLRINQLHQEFRETVLGELREVREGILDLSERRTAGMDQLRRTEIRAPRAGQVVGLAVHTLGGVIAPGAPLMDLVPEGEKLVIEARIMPSDVDKVVIDQPAVVRLSAFNMRTTPELGGVVFDVSADSLTDANTGEAYFAARIRIEEAELARLPKGLTLKPGMPAEVFMQTGERSALSYLVKPLSDALARTFNEE